MMNEKYYPCDGEDGFCPYDAEYGETCRVCCGLGVDEDEEPYDEEYDIFTPSAEDLEEWQKASCGLC